MTGLKLRDYRLDSRDDPAVLAKMDRALRFLVTPEEMKEIEPLLGAQE